MGGGGACVCACACRNDLKRTCVPDEWQPWRKTLASTKQKKNKKNREIEACLVDQSITAILAEEKRRGCVCVCVCMCVCVCVCVSVKDER